MLGDIFLKSFLTPIKYKKTITIFPFLNIINKLINSILSSFVIWQIRIFPNVKIFLT